MLQSEHSDPPNLLYQLEQYRDEYDVCNKYGVHLAGATATAPGTITFLAGGTITLSRIMGRFTITVESACEENHIYS